MSFRSNTTLVSQSFNRAIISLGANLESAVGTAEQTITYAIDKLRALSSGDFKASSLYLTSPIDCPPDTPYFVNGIVVMEVEGELTPEDFLQHLQSIEAALGRVASPIKNAPRALDLDLISFAEIRQSAANLILPHPRAATRRFVLEPLAELLPDLRLPGHTATVQELIAELPEGQIVRRIPSL